jgi:catabolite regulation protein CreA
MPNTHPQDKTLRVRRLYDPDRRSLLYVAYSTRLSTAADEGGVSTGRYRTSLCAVHLPEAPAVGAPAELPSAAVSAE